MHTNQFFYKNQATIKFYRGTLAAKIANSGADSVKTQREKILAHKNTDYSILAICTKLAETRIACVDATEFLSDVYKVVHERKTHKAQKLQIVV